MVARRKATKLAATQPKAASSGDSGDDDPVAHELACLQAMRVDALAWLADIEHRIGALEQRDT